MHISYACIEIHIFVYVYACVVGKRQKTERDKGSTPDFLIIKSLQRNAKV